MSKSNQVLLVLLAFMAISPFMCCGGCMLLGYITHLQVQTELANKAMNPKANERKSDGRGAGYMFAKEVITPKLLSPRSAEYPWDSVKSTPAGTVRLADGRTAPKWIVTGSVDSQNTFGTMIRSQWTAVVTNFDDEWFLCELRHEEKVLYLRTP